MYRGHILNCPYCNIISLLCWSSKCSTSLNIHISKSWLLLIFLDEQQINHVMQTGCSVVISIHTYLYEVKSLCVLDGWLLVSWWYCNNCSGYADVTLRWLTSTNSGFKGSWGVGGGSLLLICIYFPWNLCGCLRYFQFYFMKIHFRVYLHYLSIQFCKM